MINYEKIKAFNIAVIQKCADEISNIAKISPVALSVADKKEIYDIMKQFLRQESEG